ncbi:hypothetical protein DPMN_182664 [Dreissena polymorpha]|uniref:Uncharacterized protein n=1 Tax=Dreissena polymorpha TaxID=45954 RepID=A0A9D4I2U7_DREPO|nr:hypothetical protein DPMN_182612 [Dreissena polymorpha]KAH3748226.1 hypothetical protein DPMN_182664 [Dreissena polymorpha]
MFINPLTSGTVGLGLFLSGVLFPLHLTEVQDGGGALVQAVLLILREAENVEGFLKHTSCSPFMPIGLPSF